MEDLPPTPSTSPARIGQPTVTRYPVILHHVPDPSPPGSGPVRRTLREYRPTPLASENSPTILIRQLLTPPLNCQQRIEFYMRQHQKTMEEAKRAFGGIGYQPGPMLGMSPPGQPGTPGPDWVRRFNDMAINGWGGATDGLVPSGSGGPMHNATFRHEGFASCLPSPAPPSEGDGYQLRILPAPNQCRPPLEGIRKKLNARIRGPAQFQRAPAPVASISRNQGLRQACPKPYQAAKRSSKAKEAAMHFERILGTGTEENLAMNLALDGFGGVDATPGAGGIVQPWNYPCEIHYPWATKQRMDGHIFPFPAHSAFLLEREKWDCSRFRCEVCGGMYSTPWDIDSHRWEHPYERMTYREVVMNPTGFSIVRRQECPYIPCVEKRVWECRHSTEL